MVAGAQTTDNSKSCPSDSTCALAHKHQGHHGPKAGQWKQGKMGQGKHQMAFMKNLSESDRAAVKEVMGQYHKERKAIMEKCKVQKPAKGVEPTEAQMDAMFKARAASRMEVLKLQEKYYDKLRKTLKPYQAATLLDMNNNGARRPHMQGKHKGHGQR